VPRKRSIHRIMDKYLVINSGLGKKKILNLVFLLGDAQFARSRNLQQAKITDQSVKFTSP